MLVLEKIAVTFFLIVFIVTSLVVLYSQYYIDSYNNKKFLVLTLLFFSFITTLAIRGDIILFIVGWDGLGISSLYLIIFYPNKVSLFNSYLTFFFNRVGDIVLILFFCYICIKIPFRYFFLEELSWKGLFFLFICLLTKRAQFPFSRWLPAAMSAPTPISAMVHSSTLVTAGIVIFFKLRPYFTCSNLIYLLTLISCVTFLIGGLIGTVEKDLKKVVAFSTMSQIRIILFFFSSNHERLALSHTFCHALFKTLLFCGCGILFTWAFRNQISRSSKSWKSASGVFFVFRLRIFRIRGLSYSRSFFTKDAVLESTMSGKISSLYFCLLVGRIFTLIYSGIIFKALVSFSRSFSNARVAKAFISFFICFFGGCIVVSFKLLKTMILNNSYFFLPMVYVIGVRILLFVSLIFFFFTPAGSFLRIRNTVFHIKEAFFSYFSNLVKKIRLKFSFSDQYIFKPSIFSSLYKVYKSLGGSKLLYFLPILWILLSNYYSFSLNWTWYWSYQSLRIILNLKIENFKC